MEQEFGATPIDPGANPVRRLLERPGAFDLLHFACHGEAEADNATNTRLLRNGRGGAGTYIPEFLTAAAEGRRRR